MSDIPNTTGGVYPTYTVPNVCSHGMAWSLPCAACGRPYQPGPTYTIEPDTKRLDEIIRLLRSIEYHVRTKR